MAKNPRWWKDINQSSDPTNDTGIPVAELPEDGEPVTEDLTHEQLDAVAEERGIDLPSGLNKAEKVEFINDPANQVV